MTNNWNSGIIEEFRSNAGKVGGPFASAELLLLTTTGRKSGRPHTTPLMTLREGDTIYVFASKGGAPTNPDWFHNLKANPAVHVELGNASFRADTMVVRGEERDRIYAKQSQLRPLFAEYQQKTTRKIPVVALTRRN